MENSKEKLPNTPDQLIGENAIQADAVTKVKSQAYVVTGVNVYLPKKAAIELFRLLDEQNDLDIQTEKLFDLKHKILNSLLGE